MDFKNIIFTVTHQCNLCCKYCYNTQPVNNSFTINEINSNFIKNVKYFYKFLDQFMELNGNMPSNLILHGGEPLLINHMNIRKLFEYSERKSYNINFSVQTNGTIINQNLIKLFKEYDVSIGVSLDGDKYTNDLTRVKKNGEGTFDIIYNNIMKLKKNGINICCLCTISKYNLDELVRIYDFFKDNDILFNFRPIFPNLNSQDDFLIEVEDFSNISKELFDRWLADDDDYYVTTFVQILFRLLNNNQYNICTFSKNCNESFLNYDVDGNIYPCNRFNGIPEFCYGNIKSNSLNEIISCDLMNKLSRRHNLLKENDCRSCELFSLCNGGCPAHSYYFSNNYFAKDYYCKYYYNLMSHIYMRIKETL